MATPLPARTRAGRIVKLARTTAPLELTDSQDCLVQIVGIDAAGRQESIAGLYSALTVTSDSGQIANNDPPANEQYVLHGLSAGMAQLQVTVVFNDPAVGMLQDTLTVNVSPTPLVAVGQVPGVPSQR